MPQFREKFRNDSLGLLVEIYKGWNRPEKAAEYQALYTAAKPVLDARDAELHRVLTVDQWKQMEVRRRALVDVFVQEASAKPTTSTAAGKKKKS